MRLLGLSFQTKNNFDLSQLIWRSETISSRKQKRQVYELVEELQPNDMLIVTELSRLARSFAESQQIIQEIQKKGATLYILAPELLLKQINPKSSLSERLQVHQNQMLSNLLGIAAEIEREFIRERTLAGLQNARQANKKLGRPTGSFSLLKKKEEVIKYYEMGLSITAISKLVQVTRQTVSTFLKHYEQTRTNQ